MDSRFDELFASQNAPFIPTHIDHFDGREPFLPPQTADIFPWLPFPLHQNGEAPDPHQPIDFGPYPNKARDVPLVDIGDCSIGCNPSTRLAVKQPHKDFRFIAARQTGGEISFPQIEAAS